MKPTKCPPKEKTWGKKSERRGEKRRRKEKVKPDVSFLNPVEILLPAHARTSEAFLLDEKAAKSTTCKGICGKI